MNKGIVFYIENCITRILDSDCAPKNEHQRGRDIAKAVLMASDEGLKVAHEFLKELCDEAEYGKYR